MNNYNWAVNDSKLQRAIKEAGVGASEEKVKEIYVRLAGLVKEKNDNQTNTDDNQRVSEVELIAGGSKRSVKRSSK